MDSFKQTMQDVLENNILRYWIDNVTDTVNGGYYGRVDGHDIVHADADKGGNNECSNIMELFGGI